MKRLLSLLAATGLVAGSLLGAATTARADDASGGGTFEVGEFAVPNLVVSSPGCHRIPIAVPYTMNAPGMDIAEVNGAFFIFHGSSKHLARVDPLVLADSTRSGLLTESGVEFEDFVWCPTKSSAPISGVGRFTMRGMGLSWWKAGTPLGGAPDGYTTVPRTGTFTVKRATQASAVKLVKKGTKRTLSAKLTYFSVSKQAWKALPKGTRVELQRRAADGSGAWKRIGTVRVGAKGAVKASYRTRTTYQYRFFYPGSPTRTKVGSMVVTK